MWRRKFIIDSGKTNVLGHYPRCLWCIYRPSFDGTCRICRHGARGCGMGMLLVEYTVIQWVVGQERRRKTGFVIRKQKGMRNFTRNVEGAKRFVFTQSLGSLVGSPTACLALVGGLKLSISQDLLRRKSGPGNNRTGATRSRGFSISSLANSVRVTTRPLPLQWVSPGECGSTTPSAPSPAPVRRSIFNACSANC